MHQSDSGITLRQTAYAKLPTATQLSLRWSRD
jgi:hypothetical protein